MKQKVLTGVLLIAGTVLGGCATGRGYYVRNGPPPPRYGVQGIAPGRGYVWTDGYWDLRGNNWAWRDGRWMRPPRGRSTWVPPRWTQRGNRWQMQRGRWR
jgi:hypothetical protein